MLNTLTNLFKLENLGVVIVFLIMISVLIAAHEYGHYLFARIFGMGVEEFAIGFGKKPLWIYRRKSYLLPLAPGELAQATLEARGVPEDHDGKSIAGASLALEGSPGPSPVPVIVDTASGKALQETTNFTIRAWPVGGFVRIKGMMPEDDGSETHLPGGFYSKAPWKRFIVLLAGPAFSILAGIFLLTILYSVMPTQQPSLDPVIGYVAKDTPASKAGLKEGDRIVSIDGTPIQNFFQIIQTVRTSPGKHLNMVLDRKGAQVNITLTPDVDASPSPVMGPDLELTSQFKIQGKMGAQWSSHSVRLTVGEAFDRAVAMPANVIESLWGLLRQPAAFKSAMGGPMSIMAATKAATEVGLSGVVELAASLSISVGILNLLPFPPLDGGQMVIALAEMVRRGRRLSMRVQNAVAATGLALVMCLIVMVMFFDIQRFAGPKDNGLRQVNPPPAAATQK